MAAAVLAETQALGEERRRVALCEHLMETFVASVAQNDATGFQRTLDEVLRQAIARGDDAHLWQVAISVLRAELPSLLAIWLGARLRRRGRESFNQARITISAAMRQQHRQFVVAQKWTGDRIGQFTAQLLNTLDETQVYDTLARALPSWASSWPGWRLLDRRRRRSCGVELAALRDLPNRESCAFPAASSRRRLGSPG